MSYKENNEGKKIPTIRWKEQRDKKKRGKLTRKKVKEKSGRWCKFRINVSSPHSSSEGRRKMILVWKIWRETTGENINHTELRQPFGSLVLGRPTCCLYDHSGKKRGQGKGVIALAQSRVKCPTDEDNMELMGTTGQCGDTHHTIVHSLTWPNFQFLLLITAGVILPSFIPCFLFASSHFAHYFRRFRDYSHIMLIFLYHPHQQVPRHPQQRYRILLVQYLRHEDLIVILREEEYTAIILQRSGNDSKHILLVHSSIFLFTNTKPTQECI